MSNNTFKNIWLWSVLGGLSLLLACQNGFVITPANTRGQQFFKLFGGIENDQGRDIVQTPDGGYLLLGTLSRDPENAFIGPQNDLYLVKTDNGGNFKWGQHFGSDFQEEVGQGLYIDANGGVNAVGTVRDEDNEDILILHLDAVPALGPVTDIDSFLWGNPNQLERGADILSDGQNGFYVLGSTSDIDESKSPLGRDTDRSDVAFWHLKPNGDSLELVSQVQTYGYEQEDRGIALRKIGERFVILAQVNLTESADGYYGDMLVVVTDINGNPQVVRLFENVNPEDVQVAGDETMYLLGTDFSQADNNPREIDRSLTQIVLFKLNLSLQDEWTGAKMVGPLGSTGGTLDILKGTGGGLIVSGEVFVQSENPDIDDHTDMLLIRLDDQGNPAPEWSLEGQTFGDAGLDHAERVIAQDDDSETPGFVFTGTLGYGSTTSIALFRVDATGSLNP
jgi:hypothetical protein